MNGNWDFAKAGTVDINATIEVTGKAGNVLDLSDGILGVKTSSSDQVFKNTKGSQNLITYQGDLNYDGRVSFRDLAYLNAGASRQELTDKLDSDGQVVMEDGKAVKVATDETYASDVDANYDGKISMSDLTTLANDWGKTLHTGDEAFLGSGDKLNWDNIDGNNTWDNTTFKREILSL